MIDFRLTRPHLLTADEIALWDRLQREQPILESPYFRPEFTQAVAKIRSDVEVAVIEDDGQPVGFFPFQRSSLNLGKAVGGRLNDFHGLIIRPEVQIDARRLIQATQLASWDFDHLVGNQAAFVASSHTTQESTYIDISQGFAAYCEDRKAAGTDVIRKTQSRCRKFEREQGPLCFELHTARPEQALNQLIVWKAAQLERTGLMNLFAFDWTIELLRELLTDDVALSGVLSVLWHGEEPIAISYKLRSFHIAHVWFIAYNPQFSAYSPGMMLMLKIIEGLAEQGTQRLHLGAGDQRYKESLSNGAVPVHVGSIELTSASILLRKAWRWTRDRAAASKWLTTYGQGPLKILHPVRRWLAFR